MQTLTFLFLLTIIVVTTFHAISDGQIGILTALGFQY